MNYTDLLDEYLDRLAELARRRALANPDVFDSMLILTLTADVDVVGAKMAEFGPVAKTTAECLRLHFLGDKASQ